MPFSNKNSLQMRTLPGSSRTPPRQQFQTTGDRESWKRFCRTPLEALGGLATVPRE